MEIMTIINIATAVIASASLLLKVIAPLTKNTTDDKISSFLIKILKTLSVHTEVKKE